MASSFSKSKVVWTLFISRPFSGGARGQLVTILLVLQL
ncbi:hypothetical protein ES319_A01G241800v1 [Gossypium barbadense]|uniref:Uncharacterized protein n=1 Tax=Gossypium barbadense TaxID=3634 RepID=A0A5J5X0X4_GOSBA|nr:hypothetical protein ES319_A01G241800v1 [Gossypium barbadense]